jgi:DUF1009 family protein
VFPRLGILAGGGALPRHLADACRAGARPFFVVAFNGETDPATVDGTDHAWVDVGTVGRTISLLKEVGCQEVVLAGPIRRPRFSELRIDRRGAAMLPKLLRARGDDALLTVVIAELEAEGFSVVGADDVLGALLATEGPLGAVRPDEDAWRDIRRGVDVVRRLGEIDVGQAAIVHREYVLGVEAAEGTDALIARCVALRREDRGGVLVKIPKPGQDRRADLPAVGVVTIEAVARGGLLGVAVSAGATLVLDRAEIVRAADAAGIFVVGVTV